VFVPGEGGREGGGGLDVSGFFVAKFVKVKSVFDGEEEEDEEGEDATEGGQRQEIK